MPTVNNELQRQSIARAVDLERYKKGMLTRYLNLLADSQDEVAVVMAGRLQKIIDTGKDNGAYTTDRFKALMGSIDKKRNAVYAAIQEGVAVDIEDLMLDEIGFQSASLQSALPVSMSVASPPVAQLKAAVLSKPFEGRLLRDWYRSIELNEQNEIRRIIKNGIVQGQTMQQITARARNLLDISGHHVSAITRTAVNHTTNRARREIGRANTDIIKGIKIVATLDSRTSPICRTNDGKVLSVETDYLPPYHIGCRTTFVLLTKSYRELGLDIDEADEGTRASMDGQVPADMTYGKWLKTQPKEAVRDILGKKKADLFLKGDLDITKFTSRIGGELTLPELKKRYPKQWNKAFADVA
jgi:SPP1 gp7 family putative phage head morphogenesis protein